jgi:hypothetical protein
MVSKQIVDGITGQNLAEYCANFTTLQYLVLKSALLHISLVSDDSVLRKGFILDYQAVLTTPAGRLIEKPPKVSETHQETLHFQKRSYLSRIWDQKHCSLDSQGFT